MFARRWLVLVAAPLCLAAAACGSDSSGSSPAAAPAGAKAVASVPSSALLEAGKLQICSDIASPPLEFYGPGHQPQGSDVDLGNEIAKRLGLKAVWKNTAFSGIVPALQAGNCDAIISQLFDKPERRKVVDFVDYLKSGQALLVPKGNPSGVGDLASVCGKKVAAENGTTIADLLRAESKKCESAGKGKINVRLFLRDSDALQQVGLKQVDAYGTTTESVAYVTKKQPGQFDVAGAPFGENLCGIATNKSKPELHDAIAKAFAAMQADGAYSRVLAKWNLQLDELKPS